MYVGDYSRKTTELGPTSAAACLLRALQWLRFIPSESPRPDGSLHSLTSVAALVSDLISWPDSLHCRHTPGPCSHWATPGTRPPHGLSFTALCAKPYVFRDFHVLRPHFFLRSFLHNVLVLGGSLMTTLSYIGPSTLFPIFSIPLLSFVFSSRCLVLKHRLYLFYRWPVSARLEHNLVRADVFGSFLHCFIPVQKCAIY